MEEHLKPSLHAAIVFLEERGYRYAIIGGIALSQWGVVRATYDIDIKVLVPDTNYATARTALTSAFPTPARPHAPESPFIVSVSIEGVTIDFLLALPGYEELIIERAVQRNLGGRSAWICSAEDLVIRKVAAGREKDWPDVEALLLEQWGKLDQAYIDDWISQFAEALEKPDLLQRHKDLVTRVRSLQ